MYRLSITDWAGRDHYEYVMCEIQPTKEQMQYHFCERYGEHICHFDLQNVFAWEIQTVTLIKAP